MHAASSQSDPMRQPPSLSTVSPTAAHLASAVDGLARLRQLARSSLSLWAHRSRVRDELYRLDDHQLRDVGLSRQQVNAEAHKYFWMP